MVKGKTHGFHQFWGAPSFKTDQSQILIETPGPPRTFQQVSDPTVATPVPWKLGV